MLTYDLVLLNQLDKIEMVPPPAFCNPKWDIYCRRLGYEKLNQLAQLMGNERHTCITPLHYLNRVYAFKLFDNGNTAYDVEVMLNIPRTTAFRYYQEYTTFKKSF